MKIMPRDYQPSETEPSMNDQHQESFRRRLIAWRRQLFAASRTSRQRILHEGKCGGDLLDQSVAEPARVAPAGISTGDEQLIVLPQRQRFLIDLAARDAELAGHLLDDLFPAQVGFVAQLL